MTKQSRHRTIFIAITIFVVCMAMTKIHLNVQVTLIGYEIGRLKSKESELLEQRSLLTAQLAQLTSKSSLKQLSAPKKELL